MPHHFDHLQKKKKWIKYLPCCVILFFLLGPKKIYLYKTQFLDRPIIFISKNKKHVLWFLSLKNLVMVKINRA